MQYIAGLIAVAIGGSLIFGGLKMLYLHITKKEPLYDGPILITFYMLLWMGGASAVFLNGIGLLFDIPQIMTKI